MNQMPGDVHGEGMVCAYNILSRNFPTCCQAQAVNPSFANYTNLSTPLSTKLN